MEERAISDEMEEDQQLQLTRKVNLLEGVALMQTTSLLFIFVLLQNCLVVSQHKYS